MMGLKALYNIVSTSSPALNLVSTKINFFLQSAIASPPNNTVLVTEKDNMKPLVFESTHPYADNLDVTTPVSVPGAKGFIITFDEQTKTERSYDYIEFFTNSDRSNRVPGTEKYSGGVKTGNWPGINDRPALIINGDSFAFFFHSDKSGNDWVSLIS
jgi:hypothetical protein